MQFILPGTLANDHSSATRGSDSIINERKNIANFQLIIITHDENFLAKLGQSNVMEYYWYALLPSTRRAADVPTMCLHRRVSRDARQKSIIERHRFG